MIKTIIQVKREPFRIEEVVVDGHQPLRKINCKNFDLLISNDNICHLQFRVYIKDGRIDLLKTSELERFINTADKFYSLSITNIGVVNQLGTLFSQNEKWHKGAFSVEFYFTNHLIVHAFDVALFYKDHALVMIRRQPHERCFKDTRGTNSSE